MTRIELSTSEYHEYYKRYIDKLPEDIQLKKSFTDGMEIVYNFFNSIPKEKLEYRYQPEKWSIKEVFQHLIDTERIFMLRCFRIARRDTTPLPGYDQNIYIKPSKANEKSIIELLDEFKVNRKNSIHLLNSLKDNDLEFIGYSNNHAMSARAAAFIIPGHDIWHIDVIKDKYL